MQALVLAFFLLVGVDTVCRAQSTLSATPDSMAATTVSSVPDSVRQAVQKVFKRARLFGILSTVSGGVVGSSSAVYAANGDRHWTTIDGLLTGTCALVIGTIDSIRFSRRRERQVLVAMERGQPMPRYVARSMSVLLLF